MLAFCYSFYDPCNTELSTTVMVLFNYFVKSLGFDESVDVVLLTFLFIHESTKLDFSLESATGLN